MKMKWFLFLVLLMLIGLSIIASLMIPKEVHQKKTPLSWVTDANPQRDVQIETFNRLNPDCHLTIDPDNTGVTKVMIQSAAGMGPDLIDGVNESTIQTYTDAGILMDLTDAARKYGFGPETLPSSVRPLVMLKVLGKDGKFSERQFGYPCNVYHTQILYNKNIFDKYKIPYPPEDLTWDEYIKIAKLLTIYNDPTHPLPDIFGAAGVSFPTIIWELGGRVLNEAGTRATVNTKAYVDAYTFYQDLYYKHKIEPSPTQQKGITSQGGHGAGFINWFGEGKLAMVWGDRWYLINLRRFVIEQKKIREKWLKKHPGAKPEEGPQVLRFGSVLVPRFPNGPRYVPFGIRATGVNANGPNRDKAIKFIQYLAGKEYSQTINAGADGKPGNKKYITLNQLISPEFAGEEEVHRISIETTPFGRIARRSPFVSNGTISRIMKQVGEKIIADPNLSRKELETLLQECNDRIDLEIARNIKRDKKLQVIYRKMLEQGAEPIRYKLEEIN